MWQSHLCLLLCSLQNDELSQINKTQTSGETACGMEGGTASYPVHDRGGCGLGTRLMVGLRGGGGWGWRLMVVLEF